MLMPASLTRSRSREFLASASEPLQPRSLRIQSTLAKKHMYYPYVEKYRRCFPSSICSTLSPRNFFSRCRIEHGRNDFLSRTKLLQHRSNDPFLSKPIWYSCTSALDPPPPPLIVSIISFDTLLWTMSNLFLHYRKMCPFTIKRVSSESIAVGT